jgi:hypothetical protein
MDTDDNVPLAGSTASQLAGARPAPVQRALGTQPRAATTEPRPPAPATLEGSDLLRDAETLFQRSLKEMISVFGTADAVEASTGNSDSPVLELKQRLANIASEASSFPFLRELTTTSDDHVTRFAVDQSSAIDNTALVADTVARSMREGSTLIDWQHVQEMLASIDECIHRTLCQHRPKLLKPLAGMQQKIGEIEARLDDLLNDFAEADCLYRQETAEWHQLEALQGEIRDLTEAERVLRCTIFILGKLEHFEQTYIAVLDRLADSQQSATASTSHPVLADHAASLSQAAALLSDLFELMRPELFETVPWMSAVIERGKSYSRRVYMLGFELLERAASVRDFAAAQRLGSALALAEGFVSFLDALEAEAQTRAADLVSLLDPGHALAMTSGASRNTRNSDAAHGLESMQKAVDSRETNLLVDQELLENAALLNMLWMAAPADDIPAVPDAVTPMTAHVGEHLIDQYRQNAKTFYIELTEYLDRLSFLEEVLSTSTHSTRFDCVQQASNASGFEKQSVPATRRAMPREVFFRDLTTRLVTLYERLNCVQDQHERVPGTSARSLVAICYPLLGEALRTAARHCLLKNHYAPDTPVVEGEVTAHESFHQLDDFLERLGNAFSDLVEKAWARRFARVSNLQGIEDESRESSPVRLGIIHTKYGVAKQLRQCLRLAWAYRNALPALERLMRRVASTLLVRSKLLCERLHHYKQTQKLEVVSMLLSVLVCLWSLRESVCENLHGYDLALDLVSSESETSADVAADEPVHAWLRYRDQIDQCGRDATRTLLELVANQVEAQLHLALARKQHQPEDVRKSGSQLWAGVTEASMLLRRFGVLLHSCLPTSSIWMDCLREALLEPLEEALVYCVVLRPINTVKDLNELRRNLLPLWRLTLLGLASGGMPDQQRTCPEQLQTLTRFEHLIELECEEADAGISDMQIGLPVHVLALFAISRSDERILQPHIRLQWSMERYRTWLKCHIADERTIWGSIEPSIRLYGQQVQQSSDNAFIPQFRILQHLRHRLDSETMPEKNSPDVCVEKSAPCSGQPRDTNDS